MTKLQILRFVAGFFLAVVLLALRRAYLPDMSLAVTAIILVIVLIIAYAVFDMLFKEPKED